MGVFFFTSGRGPEATLEEFLDAWHSGDYAAAAARTDGDPRLVARSLQTNVDGLDGATLETEVRDVDEREDTASATVEFRWQVPEIGEFSYENPRIELRRADEEWAVSWRERVIHPELDFDGRFGTLVDPPERADILDRVGRPLVRNRPVVEIGIIPANAGDVKEAAAAIEAHTEADAEDLLASIEKVDPENFVPAITLRKEDFRDVQKPLEAVEGVEFGYRELPLAPTKEFGHALLGAVAPATAEQLEERAELEQGALVGQWGLQAAFDDRLAGESTRRVVFRRDDGVPVETLKEVEGGAGQPLRTTLDLGAQTAAETALEGVGGEAAVVAIDATSGDVLAAANRPADESFNRAFEGQYPPGSTFKVVTTAALLDEGLSPQDVVDCPQFRNVAGKVFRNFEGSAAGAVPFTEDFAESCNTAFVSLVDRLKPPALGEWGRRFGLGTDHELDVASYGGSVPPGRDLVEEAASMIGQGRILASPLAMAGVAATVAEGRWRAPRLLRDDPRRAIQPLPSDTTATLRELMRTVVTSGTGTALASVAGEPIGKSGTAEYGSGDPPPTHAWFIAARDGVAVSVLLEDKPSGGEYAAPVAARFFQAFDAQESSRMSDVASRNSSGFESR